MSKVKSIKFNETVSVNITSERELVFISGIDCCKVSIKSNDVNDLMDWLIKELKEID